MVRVGGRGSPAWRIRGGTDRNTRGCPIKSSKWIKVFEAGTASPAPPPQRIVGCGLDLNLLRPWAGQGAPGGGPAGTVLGMLGDGGRGPLSGTAAATGPWCPTRAGVTRAGPEVSVKGV